MIAFYFRFAQSFDVLQDQKQYRVRRLLLFINEEILALNLLECKEEFEIQRNADK